MIRNIKNNHVLLHTLKITYQNQYSKLLTKWKPDRTRAIFSHTTLTF